MIAKGAAIFKSTLYFFAATEPAYTTPMGYVEVRRVELRKNGWRWASDSSKVTHIDTMGAHNRAARQMQQAWQAAQRLRGETTAEYIG